MSVKRVLTFGFLLFLFTGALIGDDRLEVLQPTLANYSDEELSALILAMDDLSSILRDGDWASRRTFSAQAWQSLDFSVYTAGVLAGFGYDVRIVSGDGWPDGIHAWVLVGISLPDRTAWIPVEAAPRPGGSQEVLGWIPWGDGPTGESRFNEAYTDFASGIEAPANLSPIASIRVPMAAFGIGEKIKFSSLGTYDPDGEIVRYHWNFGDGTTDSDREQVVHTFEEPGDYVVSLTVIDDRGKRAVANLTVHPYDAEAEVLHPPDHGSGCGCR